ncbi:MAG: NAD(P)H-dependent oxidoreductase [Bacteriovorax sp.]
MRTLIILGHPDKKSLCGALADSYEKGAKEKGGEVMRLNLIDLRFDPILRQGYKREQNLEPDLVEAQRLIKWANHLVFVYPVWWSAQPALLKGFIDRVFLPGFAFKYRENSPYWDKLLKGRRARLILTSDAPVFWLYFVYFHPALNMMKKAVLEFCGVRPVSVTSFGSIKNASEKKKESLLYRAYRMGLDDN